MKAIRDISNDWARIRNCSSNDASQPGALIVPKIHGSYCSWAFALSAPWATALNTWKSRPTQLSCGLRQIHGRALNVNSLIQISSHFIASNRLENRLERLCSQLLNETSIPRSSSKPPIYQILYTTRQMDQLNSDLCTTKNSYSKYSICRTKSKVTHLHPLRRLEFG